MLYENVIVETNDKFVGKIILNRPEQMNTFTTELSQELYDALWQMDGDEAVRVILIKGNGRAFCAWYRCK